MCERWYNPTPAPAPCPLRIAAYQTQETVNSQCPSSPPQTSPTSQIPLNHHNRPVIDLPPIHPIIRHRENQYSHINRNTPIESLETHVPIQRPETKEVHHRQETQREHVYGSTPLPQGPATGAKRFAPVAFEQDARDAGKIAGDDGGGI